MQVYRTAPTKPLDQARQKGYFLRMPDPHLQGIPLLRFLASGRHLTSKQRSQDHGDQPCFNPVLCRFGLEPSLVQKRFSRASTYDATR